MEDALFVDRADAARQLIQKIPPVDARRAILLGIPRGGVPMTVILAEALHLPFDLLLVRKLTVSSDPEYAIGAVSLTDARVAEKGHFLPSRSNSVLKRPDTYCSIGMRFIGSSDPFPISVRRPSSWSMTVWPPVEPCCMPLKSFGSRSLRPSGSPFRFAPVRQPVASVPGSIDSSAYTSQNPLWGSDGSTAFFPPYPMKRWFNPFERVNFIIDFDFFNISILFINVLY